MTFQQKRNNKGKYKMKTLLTAILITAATITSRAEVIQLNFTVALTALFQNSTVTNGTAEVTGAPIKQRVITKDLLTYLAEGEYHNANYPSPTFPIGAKLVYLSDSINPSNNHFMVTDSLGSVLCDVSDMIWIQTDSPPPVLSGTFNHANVNDKFSYNYIFSIYYDETNAGGSAQFYFAGLATETITDTVKNGVATRARTLRITSMTGSGYNGQDGMVVTGSAAGSGKTTL